MDSLHLIFIIIFFLFSIIALNNHFKEDFKEHFPVANYYYRVKNSNTPLSNIFNIDKLIKEQPNHLGWKNFWRKHYSNSTVALDGSFKNSPYEDYSDSSPLYFDGVRNVKTCNSI